METETLFQLDQTKCIKCGNCINTCTGMVLKTGADGYPQMKKFSRFGWSGCWKCQHCLAVCPQGAISIFGKKPEDSLLPPDPSVAKQMERLVVNRRSCRRYLNKNVDPQIIDRILSAMAAVPTGGNASQVEYTVIDDQEQTNKIRQAAYSFIAENVSKGIYPGGLSEFYYRKMKQSEKTVRKGDMLFCGAPHLFIAHQRCVGKWQDDAKADCHIAMAYFELLANAFGLGTVYMSYPASVIEESNVIKKMLHIPASHNVNLIVGFGYPEIKYARGVQKDKTTKIHRFSESRCEEK